MNTTDVEAKIDLMIVKCVFLQNVDVWFNSNKTS